MTTGSRAASKHILHSNCAFVLGFIQSASSPDDESGVNRGEVTKADVSACRYERTFTRRGALCIRRIETGLEVVGAVAVAVAKVRFRDCCGSINGYED